MSAEPRRWLIRGMTFVLGGGIIVLLASVAGAASSVFVLVFVAVLLGSALDPIVDVLRDRTPLNRAAAILAVYATIIALLIAVGVLFAPIVVAQLGAFSARLPAFLQDAQTWAATLQPRPLAKGIAAVLTAMNQALVPVDPNAGDVVALGITTVEIVASVTTLLALVFFWTVEHARLKRYALAFIPLERRGGVREAWDDVEVRLGRWVRGQLTIMVTMGVAAGGIYALLGLEAAAVLGLAAGIAEAIPLIGPLVGAIPALVVTAATRPELLPIVTIAYVILQFVEGNVVVPVIMRNSIGLSPFVVLVSLLIGASLGGIEGAFLAVPVAAAAEVILERLQLREVPIAQDSTADLDDVIDDVEAPSEPAADFDSALAPH